MKKQVRLVDFQIYARPTGLAAGEQRPINEALFTAFEPVRLWLKERQIRAPFRKIVVSLADSLACARWHGNVLNALGICEVTEAVEIPMLLEKAGDHRWVLGIAEHALGCVTRSTGWRSDELESFMRGASEKTLPLVHFFDNLARVDSVSGVKCVPWLSTRPGETLVGVRLVSNNGDERDVIVLSKPEPLYLEDGFPMMQSAIRSTDFVLLDNDGKTLATVPVQPRPPQ